MKSADKVRLIVTVVLEVVYDGEVSGENSTESKSDEEGEEGVKDCKGNLNPSEPIGLLSDTSDTV